jgi:hypothetical protein
VVRSWPLVLYPAVIFATLNFGLGVAVTLCFLDVAAAVFQSPPYNMSPGVQIVLPVLIGGVLGSIAGGYVTDIYCRYRASMNNGVFEAENRLLLIFLPGLATSAGVLMSASPHLTYGFGADGGAGMVGVLRNIILGHCPGSEVE